MKKYFVYFLCICIVNTALSQDVAFAKKTVDTLTSPYFWGRGYTNEGMKKAADYLAEQFRQYGLTPLKGENYFQKLSYPVNTFPGRMELMVNDRKLIPGKDFIITPESKGIHAQGSLENADSSHFVNKNYRLIFSLENKLTWSAAQQQADYTEIQLDKNQFKEIPYNFTIDVENKMVKNFACSNVCGMVKGTARPDSILVITAHYDHLGGMGSETYFPGANDNASGISLLLGLAKYYANHPQRYSMAFICFAGEEAGLVGSKYFTEHPLFPLQNIRFLLNLDLEGTGDEGITVVNATEFKNEFDQLNLVNDSGKYLVKINARTKAANSDHYWFSEKGVPSFFFYTLGGIKAYHDVYDRAETLPLNEYEDLIKLIIGFEEKLQN